MLINEWLRNKYHKDFEVGDDVWLEQSGNTWGAGSKHLSWALDPRSNFDEMELVKGTGKESTQEIANPGSRLPLKVQEGTGKNKGWAR